TSGAIFLFSFVVLTILRVPNPTALAAIAGVADLIPLIGVYVMLTPMALAAFSVSTTTAIIAIAVMVAYQQFEDRVLVPRIYGQTRRLPAIAVVLAIRAGGELLGLVGALLALPAAAAIRVIVEYFADVKRKSIAAAAAEAAPEEQILAPDEDAEMGNGQSAMGRPGVEEPVSGSR